MVWGICCPRWPVAVPWCVAFPAHGGLLLCLAVGHLLPKVCLPAAVPFAAPVGCFCPTTCGRIFVLKKPPHKVQNVPHNILPGFNWGF